MRTAVLASLFALSLAGAASAQVLPDIGADLRLQNELRWQQGQIRALEAQADRLQTNATVRRLQSGRAPNPTLELRQYQRDAAEAEALLQATEAASTARAAGLRAASPAYDQRLRELGYASSLPVSPRR
jgi:small-conductance mechanosensitive channel